jgi:hypothetical protein
MVTDGVTAPVVAVYAPCPFCNGDMEPRFDYGRIRYEHTASRPDCAGFALYFYPDDPAQVTAWSRRSPPIKAGEAVPVGWQWSDRNGMWYSIDSNTDRMPFAQQEALARSVAADNGGTARAVYASPQPEAYGVRAGIEALLDAYDAETTALPLGHEMPTRRSSTYNWRRAIVDDLRKLAALPPYTEQGETKP